MNEKEGLSLRKKKLSIQKREQKQASLREKDPEREEDFTNVTNAELVLAVHTKYF